MKKDSQTRQIKRGLPVSKRVAWNVKEPCSIEFLIKGRVVPRWRRLLGGHLFNFGLWIAGYRYEKTTAINGRRLGDDPKGWRKRSEGSPNRESGQ